MSTLLRPGPPPVRDVAGRRPLVPRRLSGSRLLAGAALAVLGVVVVSAVLAPLLAPHDPTAVDLLAANAPASAAHPLGTDQNGRDILSRLLFGARSSLLGPAIVVTASTALGVLLALVGAWYGGWADAVAGRLVDLVFAFPGLVLAIVAATMFGTGFVAPVVALSVAYVPVIARVLRAAALRECNLPYVAALRIQGVPTPRIWLRHLLPNLSGLVVVQAGIGFGYAMLDLAAIAYLGLGPQPPSSDWGVMVAEGQSSILEGFPQQSLYGSLVVLATVVSLNVVSSALADRFGVAAVA